MQGRLWNKGFLLCLALQALYMLSFNMVTPLIAQYVMLMGEPASIAGIVAGMFSFLAFAFRPFVGYLTDQMDRKRFMLLGFALCALGMFGYGFSSTVVAMAFFRILHAFALCIQTTVISVVAIDFIPRARVAEGVGYVGIAAMVGMSLGPGLGMVVAQSVGHRFAFWLGGLVVLATIACLVPLPGGHVEKRGGRKAVSFNELVDVKTLPLAISALSFAFCAGLTSSFMVLLGSQRGIGGIALFFFVSSLGMMLVRPCAGRYADRHGLRRIGSLGFASEGLCMVVLSVSWSLGGILVGSVFRVFGQGMAQSAFQGQALKDVSDDRRGRVSSTFYLGVDAGQGLGSIVGGLLVEGFGYAAVFMSGPAVLVVGFISFWIGELAGRSSRGDCAGK